MLFHKLVVLTTWVNRWSMRLYSRSISAISRALIFETLSVFCSLYLLFLLEKLGDSLVAEDFLLNLINNLMLLEASTSQGWKGYSHCWHDIYLQTSLPDPVLSQITISPLYARKFHVYVYVYVHSSYFWLWREKGWGLGWSIMNKIFKFPVSMRPTSPLWVRNFRKD